MADTNERLGPLRSSDKMSEPGGCIISLVPSEKYQNTHLELVRTIYFLKTQDVTCSICDSQFTVRIIMYSMYSSGI